MAFSTSIVLVFYPLFFSCSCFRYAACVWCLLLEEQSWLNTPTSRNFCQVCSTALYTKSLHGRRVGVVIWNWFWRSKFIIFHILVRSEKMISRNFLEKLKLGVNCWCGDRFLRIIFDKEGQFNRLECSLSIISILQFLFLSFGSTWRSKPLILSFQRGCQVQDIHHEVLSVNQNDNTDKLISGTQFRTLIMGNSRQK